VKRYFISYLTITLLIALSLAVHTSIAGSNFGWHESSIQHDGLTRYFRYYIPENIADRPALVLLLHGGTQSMRKIFRTRAGGTQEWQHLADEYGFLLLTPNGVNVKDGDTKGDRQNWNDCRVAMKGDNSSSTADDVGFVSDLLSWAVTHYHINESRIYSTGASNGGMMTLRLVTELGDKLAAAAVFIANQPVKTDCRQPVTPIPMLMMSGTDDPLMLWKGGKIRDRGPVMMSAPETLDFWLKVNQADKNRVSTVQLPDIDPEDDSMIFKSVYPAKPGGQPLWFYKVVGGGHTMPSVKHKVPFLAHFLVGNQNRDLEGADEAWNFLRRFSRKN
jgi:polyhydroxybutyrate depolymerase